MRQCLFLNIIKKEFTGYIRVKVTDESGKIAVQDVLVVADGNYPDIEVSSLTEKNEIGEVNLSTYDVQIDGRKFRSAKKLAVSEIESDWKTADETTTDEAMKAEIEKMVNGTDGYVAHDFWAMNDINLSIVATDTEMSSELKSLKWSVYNYPNTINLIPQATDTPLAEYGSGSIVLPTYRDEAEIDVDDASTNDVWKKTINAADYLPGSTSGLVAKEANVTEKSLIIPETAEGLNVLVVTAEDVAGLTATSYYYYFMDNTNPDANYKLVQLDEQVVQLFSDADTVTKWQQGINMTESKDVVNTADLISNIDTVDEDVYQYRFLARDYTVAEADIDLDTVDANGVPYGYTATAPASTALTYGTWLDWSLDETVAILTEEFDGLIQVRVQDKAGNWSVVTAAEEESIIADNTDAVLGFEAFELEDFADASIFADSILLNGTNVIENRETKWIKDSALLWTQVMDEDLANEIRSSGLFDGSIKIDVVFDEGNEGKEITLYAFDEFGNRDAANDLVITDTAVIDSTNIAKYCFTSSDLDKALGFMIQYDGTGIADITYTITDKAENVLGYSEEFKYNVRLKVDKINPIVTFKGYDETDAAQTDLLVPNTGAAVDYELRDMPWGPNSQILEVKVVDNDITSIQSGLINGVIKIKSDKDLIIKNQNGGADLNVIAGVEATLDINEYFVQNIENLDYTFYAVYEGTGIAKVEVYAEDEATNVRDYPSAQAEPVEYDVKLRVDKINPSLDKVKLVETADDVEDGFMLFTVDKTEVEMNTRKQLKLAYDINDDASTVEQSGPNMQKEYTLALTDVKDSYVDLVIADKAGAKNFYNDSAVYYSTNDVAEDTDPHIDYILLPVEIGEINGQGGFFESPIPTTNEEIAALVDAYIAKYADTTPIEWQLASWKDGGIVVPEEFQGAIVLRTIDRVGNIDYSAPVRFVAESRTPLIDFKPQSGYIYSQNNYGWSKRAYDYIEIKIKDDNEEKVDAWLENAFIKVTDLTGADITDADTVKFALTLDAETDVDPSTLTYEELATYGTAHADYGYDVIADLVAADEKIETIARDEEGYIHLGYVRVEEDAQINVTIFDKAKYEGADYSGNMTKGIWTSRFDRVAPVVTKFDLKPIYEGPEAEDYNNGFAVEIEAEDALSGIAPYITDAEYNVYTPENIPAEGVFATDKSYLYTIDGDIDETFNAGTFNENQYEMPGIQYALIPANGIRDSEHKGEEPLEDVMPWDFENDPTAVYDENGYNNGEMGAEYVWHNYVNAETPVIPAEFDGLIVVRAIDKAGNITVIGYSSILDVEADDDWNNETQYIQVRTDEKWNDGSITKVEYYGNNNLLYPESMRKDLLNSYNDGEGAIIEVVEEGITNVVITATEEYVNTKTAKANRNERNADWEGDMVIGNATSAGYVDWKFQVVDVKIDKTNPVVSFELVDEAGNVVADEAVDSTVEIKITELYDPIPNIPDDLGTRSHIPSDIAKVEWCAVPEGSMEENWQDAESNEIAGTIDLESFTGTIKVRVTDNAGNETVKSQRINIDRVDAIINLSKSYDDVYSYEPVDVFVTVTENDEFSDVANVEYVVTDAEGNVYEEDVLTLIGGTISIDREGVYNVKVTAANKAGKTTSKEVIVRIDRTAPAFNFDVEDSAGSVEGRTTNEDVKIIATDVADATSGVAKVEYAVVPEGSLEENYAEMTLDGDKYTADYAVEDAFTGTVKVRVTDVSGLETVKTMKINIDKKAALVVISKSNEEDYSKENVNVFVTVTENAEYSDVAEVTYTVTNGSSKKTANLALNGGTISVTEEGTTEIVVTAKTKAGVEAIAATTVLIDKTAPTLEMDVVDANDVSVIGGTTNTNVTIKATADDAVSGVAKVEYAVVPEGSVEENYEEMNGDVLVNVNEALTATVKVRVTDVAGHVTVKSGKIHVDKKAPLVVISKSNEEDYSKENVNVFVTVSENAEYSDVTEVTYTVNGVDAGNLALNGGTISVTEEGTTEIVVTAKTKAGVEATAETTVLIDKTAPTLEMDVVDAKGVSVIGGVTSDNVTIKATANDAVSGVAKVEYAVVPEGSVEENYTEMNGSVLVEVEEALTATVKVRVTDNAGHVTVESGKINVDKVKALINISKSNVKEYVAEDVYVFVTVSENAEYSDVTEVTYTVNGKNQTTLPLTGGAIHITDEGTSKIVVTAKTKAGVTDTAETTVHIDRTAPTFDMDVVDAANNSVMDGTTNTDVTIKATNVDGTVSNAVKVEYAVIPEGSSVENYAAMTKSGNGYAQKYEVTDAFTGTIKVRVTDAAGNETVKSTKINVDKAQALISISKSNTSGKCSNEPVDVFVTVTESAEYSDVVSVTYKLNNGAEKTLSRSGGTITVVDEGVTTIVVTAKTKAGETVTAEAKVIIHYEDLAMPTLGGNVKAGSWVANNELEIINNSGDATSVWYSLNNSVWTEATPVNGKILIAGLETGENTLRLRARAKKTAECLCESDVNTYVVYYDDGTVVPTVNVSFDAVTSWRKDAVVVGVAASNGESKVDIAGIKYELEKVSNVAGASNSRVGYLASNGGNIIIQEEGEWYLSNVIVTMESGKQYYLEAENNAFTKLGAFDATKNYECVVARIDKSAPVIEDIELIDDDDIAGLFGAEEIVGEKYQKKLRVATEDEVSAIASVEYAVVEKGNQPEWVKFPGFNTYVKKFEMTTSNNVVTKAFDGVVMVKVTDEAGNETIATKTVFTEGIAPEVSLSYPYLSEDAWSMDDVVITVDVLDKGVSSEIAEIEYRLQNIDTGASKKGYLTKDNWAKLNSNGGQIIISEEGRYKLTVVATDTVGNESEQEVDVRIDRTAPTYSGSVELSTYNVHTINNWDDIHDGWTYNHAVDISGIIDELSGVKSIEVKVTTESGNVAETTLSASQTSAEFDTDGKYDLIITDNAGNVREISFVIDKDLKNVINVVAVDEVGKINVAVTDGNERITFFTQEDSENAEVEKMNGVTNQIWDGKTGVKFIYGKNDSGKLTNKLHAIVAPSNNYDITLANVTEELNRYVEIPVEGGIEATRIRKIFNPAIEESVNISSVLDLDTDGVYEITTK